MYLKKFFLAPSGKHSPSNSTDVKRQSGADNQSLMTAFGESAPLFDRQLAQPGFSCGQKHGGLSAIWQGDFSAYKIAHRPRI